MQEDTTSFAVLGELASGLPKDAPFSRTMSVRREPAGLLLMDWGWEFDSARCDGVGAQPKRRSQRSRRTGYVGSSAAVGHSWRASQTGSILRISPASPSEGGTGVCWASPRRAGAHTDQARKRRPQELDSIEANSCA